MLLLISTVLPLASAPGPGWTIPPPSVRPLAQFAPLLSREAFPTRLLALTQSSPEQMQAGPAEPAFPPLPCAYELPSPRASPPAAWPTLISTRLLAGTQGWRAAAHSCSEKWKLWVWRARGLSPASPGSATGRAHLSCSSHPSPSSRSSSCQPAP